MKLNRSLARQVPLFAIGWVSLSTVAIAQETPADDGEDTPEIIVTAQKRAQSLQDVPIAVSAFNDEALRDKRIEDAVDLSFSVPNLTVTDAGASLRGIGNLAISSTAEGGLGYHINGAYIGAPAGVQNYFDIERIEVLRGPQGTLYGRNTTAGVLNIITQKPTGEFGGYLTLGYGNYNAVRAEGALNVPLGPNLGLRIAGLYEDHEGYTTNVFNGHDVDDRHMYSLRGTLGYDDGDTTATLMVAYFNEDDARNFGTKGVCKKDAAIGCSPLERGFETPDSRVTVFNTLGAITGIIATGFGPAAVDYFAASVNPTSLRQINQDLDPEYNEREWFATLELSHDFGDITLTSLTSFQDRHYETFNDFDRFVPSLGLTRSITFDLYANGTTVTTNRIQSGRRDRGEYRQWTQELRAASNFAGPFNFLLGANYYDQTLSYFVDITHVTLAARQQQTGLIPAYEAYRIQTDPSTTESWGLFGEAYFDLSSRTRLTGGIRYSHDEKHIQTRQLFLDPVAGQVRPFTVGAFERGVFTGRIVLDHELSDRVMIYASASRGYKAGGINPGGATVPTFDPEFINAGEIGIKASTADRSFTLNASAFYYDYSDLQIGQVGVTSANTVNADAEIYGAEIEWIARPSERWRFDGSLSLLHAEITNFRSGDEGDPNGVAPGTVLCTGTDALTCTPGGPGPYFTSGGVRLKVLDGNALPFSPGIKLAVGLQYRLPLANGWSFTARVDHYQQSQYFGSAFNKPIDEFSGYSQTDLKFTLAGDQESWQLQGYVKNLFDNDDVIRMSQEGPLVGRFRSLIILEPRTYGVSATYRF